MILSEEQLKEYGTEFAEKLKRGDVIALIGDLGAGKTTLSKAIAKGLGIEEHITSPTFTLINEYYSGRLPLYHFDVYRIDDISEMDELGYEEYFFGDGVCIVEWADKVEEIIPEDAIKINIKHIEDQNVRMIERLDEQTKL